MYLPVGQLFFCCVRQDFLKQNKQHHLKNLHFRSQLYYTKEDKRITS